MYFGGPLKQAQIIFYFIGTLKTHHKWFYVAIYHGVLRSFENGVLVNCAVNLILLVNFSNRVDLINSRLHAKM